MIAYRLGELPIFAERNKWHEHEQLPSGPRLGRSQAALVMLPDGTLFGEADDAEYVGAWFEQLCQQAGVSSRRLAEMLSDLDLSVWMDRWYALNELLEISAVRAVFSGKPALPEVVHPLTSRAEITEILSCYGMRLGPVQRQDGSVHFYAVRYGPKKRVYLGTFCSLNAGQISRESVTRRLRENGLVPLAAQQEEQAA